MHFAGIVIKSKELENTEARMVFGDHLVQHGVADYYIEEDDHDRQRKATKESTTASLKEYYETFKEMLDSIEETDGKDKYFSADLWPFGVVDEGMYISEIILPSDFWELLQFPEIRSKLINTYIEGYKKATLKMYEEYMNEHNDEYEVILIDFHN